MMGTRELEITVVGVVSLQSYEVAKLQKHDHISS